MRMIHFILGGARSGKSRFAQQQASAIEQESSSQVIYVATATPFDDGMKSRIKRHQADRPEHWKLAERGVSVFVLSASLSLSTNILLLAVLSITSTSLPS